MTTAKHSTDLEADAASSSALPAVLTIDPDLIYTTRGLAVLWGRQKVRHLEGNLERIGVPLLHVGQGLTLVRGRDLWRLFDTATGT